MLFPSRAQRLRVHCHLSSATPSSPASRSRARSFWVTLALCAFALAIGCGTASAQRPTGIDVSSYQGSSDSLGPTNINWAQVKGDGTVSFAWAKATQGTYYIDADFVYNEVNAKANGVLIGAYHFADPVSDPGTSGADSEASYFLAEAGPYIQANGSYMVPMLDAEISSPGTQSAVSAWINEWCQDIVNNSATRGIALKPIVYTYQSWAADYINGPVTQWPLWMASPNGQSPQTGAPTATTPWSTWTMWQYGEVTITGVEGAVDADVFNGTIGTLTNLIVGGSSVDYFWDPQGTSGGSPYTGSLSGTWESTDWSVAGTGQSSPVAWAEGRAACFGANTGNGTPAYTVTMNSTHTVNGIYDGALSSDASTITLTGSGVITITNGPQPFDVFNTSDGSLANLTVSNVISGAGQLVAEDNGQLSLNATNTYTGGTQLGAGSHSFTGTLNFNNGAAFGSGSISMFNGGGTLAVEGSAAVTVNNSFTAVTGSLNLVGNAAGLTCSGPWSLGTSVFSLGTGGATNLVTLSGVVSGSGGFIKYNPGGLTLAAANTFSGTNLIEAGTVNISADNNLGAAPGSAVANSIALSNATLNASATFTLNTNRGITLKNNGTLGVSSGATLTYGGIIAGAFALNKSGPGTLIITGNHSSYSSGTVISAGVLQTGADHTTAGTPSNLGNTPSTFNATNVTLAGGTLQANASFFLNPNRGVLLATNSGLSALDGDILGIPGPISQTGGRYGINVTAVGSGAVVLTGTNSYSGTTTVSSGTLSLSTNGSLSSGSSIIIGAGGTFDVSTLASNTYTIGGSATLTASGTGTSIGTNAAVINGAPGGTINLLSRPIVLTFTPTSFTGDANHPALYIAQGSLLLAHNAFTVTNLSGTPLGAGTYVLIQQASGIASNSASSTVTVAGSGVVPGNLTSISISGGNVNLVVGTPASFSALSSSQSVFYGASGITLAGTVSGSGPVYPAMGETVTATINGNAQDTSISDSNGDFSFIYNPSTIPASGTPYTIAYSYAGDASLSTASDTSTALTVNPLPVILAGSRPYDGTTTAAAAILSVTNSVGSDVVTLVSGSATLTSPNVGPEAIASAGTLALGGAAAGDYTLAGASGTVTITVPPFAITGGSVDATGSNFVITWQSAPGATYNVVNSTDPTVALDTWTNVAGPIIATNTVTSVTNPITSSESFFDVIGQ